MLILVSCPSTSHCTCLCVNFCNILRHFLSLVSKGVSQMQFTVHFLQLIRPQTRLSSKHEKQAALVVLHAGVRRPL